ncbi:MAG: lipopolysaccharide biosynthesis protein, partial [Bacteroidota bacterium]
SQLKTTIPSYLNDIGVRLMTIVVVTVYFNRWITFDQFVIAFVAIYGIQFALLLAYIFSFDRPGFKIDWAVFREKRFLDLIRYGLLLWFAGIASLGLKYFDSVMIGKYLPLAFVGIYTIAAFIPTVIEAPLVAFEKVASAKIAYAWNENDMDQIRQIYKRSSFYLFLLGGWIFLVVNSNVDALFTFLPEGYSEGKNVILVISFGTLFNMATGLNAPILFNSDRYRYGAFFLVSLAFIVLGFQMFLIPRFGLLGAAIATASASVLYNSMLLFSVWRFFRIQPFDKDNLRLLLVFGITFTLSRFLFIINNPFASIFVNTSVVTIVYCGLVWVAGLAPDLKNQLMSWREKDKI